ncbi:uncharacterized protein BJ212DRAFT_980745 [Suillus subaureus]|uniref:Uncharacterized protein n=1 Tax=Suillus subaureus TaxID=48587 RepID=A0A9P7EHW9_9AGAM|nr:uncharacterized protein BJ212DRAFT_980745 [Suillus subaureus]KAG1821108.1 hypothetical protein BJ212DRAFT_980745 [Suillus subaureus]
MSEAEVFALSTSRANDNAAPQKRWGPFTREQPVDAQKLEEKEPKTPRPTRSQKFLDLVKAGSMPNLNLAANVGAKKISRSVRFAPCEATASTSAPTHSTDAPVDELDEASQALGIDVNDGGIYLTFDSDLRSSRGEAVLTFLSPIPDGTSNSPPRASMQPVDELQSFLGVEN